MTNPPDWKQDQAETSRLPRKGDLGAQTMLAPCPFCGGEAVYDQGTEDEFGYDRVVCLVCDAQTCWTESNREQKIVEWNTRAASAPGAVLKETLARFLCEELALEPFDHISRDKYTKDAASILARFPALAPPEEASTAAGEAVAHLTVENMEAAFVEWRKTLTVTSYPSRCEIFSQGYVAGWNAKEAQPEEISGEEMDAIERAAIAGTPLLAAPPAAQTDGVREKTIEECGLNTRESFVVASRLAAIEECAGYLETSYPDHAWLNAACAALRSLALTRPQENGATK